MGTSTRLGDAAESLDVASGTAAAEQSPAHDETSPITACLLEWQTTGKEACLDRLCVSVLPVAHRMIAATLHRLGIHDPAAVDETLSLVLDHLRRMPGASTSDRPVARFIPQSDIRSGKSATDPGLAFMLWLSRERAADVARAWRRRSRHAIAWSQLDKQTTRRVHASAATSDDGGASTDLHLRLHEAIPRLPPRERLVIELLIEGKSQTVISHVLDTCEGTVSRLRTRAIARLRTLLAE